MSVRTRFAPSPTGFMHVGNMRTALYAWLYARKHGGQFILRIEDTDKEREVEGSIGHIMESLRWVGIAWDEGPDIDGPHSPYVQSARLPLYKQYAEKLIASGHAYADPYTSDEVEAFRKEAEAAKRPFLFREHRPTATEAWDGTQALRFRTPVKRYTWQDVVRGELTAGEEALDDFILIKADGYPTYNFAHVVDDIEMQVTHVMRGEEFIASTPKFLALYEVLGAKTPAFATLPPILGESGTKKLSKRDGAKDILEYRAEGYLPGAFMNFLALLGWHPSDDREFLSKEELIAAFELERVQKAGARFDDEKLLHLNQLWMRSLSDADFIAALGDVGTLDEGRLAKAVPSLKERARTFGEAQEMLRGELGCLFTEPVLNRSMLVSKEPTEQGGVTGKHLEAMKALIAGLSAEASADTIKAALMPYADQEGRGPVLWPLRYALSGAERSPDPFTLIFILGKKESLHRIDAALGILTS